MKTRTVLNLLLTIGAACSLHAAPEITTKSFDAKSGGTLTIEADRGNISVQRGNDSQVKVTVSRELKGSSDSKQADLLKQHKLEFSQDGGEIKVKGSRGKTGWSFRDPFNKLQVHYTVMVPEKFNANLNTAGGNIELSSLEGSVHAHTSGGNIKMDSVNGPVKANTSGGNVSLANSSGPADLGTSGGDITAGKIAGNLSARTSGGNIRVESVSGSVDARTSGGDIKIADAGGPINARTSGGNVAARLAKAPQGDSVLKTSGGNVQLEVPAGISLTVQGETSGGDVSSDFPAEINKSRTRLQASLNGGGAGVELGTSGGNIRLIKK